MSDPPKPTKASVEAFQTTLAALLPGMLTAAWARWTAHVKDEKAIYINATMLPEKFTVGVVALGGVEPPDEARKFLDIFKPLETISRSGTCGRLPRARADAVHRRRQGRR